MAQPNYITLAEFDFSTRTRYYSFDGVPSPTRFYKERIVSLGTISRQIAVQSTSPALSSAQMVLSNVEREFNILRDVESFRGTKVRLIRGDINAGLSAMSAVFAGTIYDWDLSMREFSVTIQDASLDKLKSPFGTLVKTVNSNIFTNLPSTTPTGQLVPIIYGITYTGAETTGRTPAYQIDPFSAVAGKPYRYVVAQHFVLGVNAVFGTGGLITSSHYAVNIYTYDGVVMTAIDMDADYGPQVTCWVSGFNLSANQVNAAAQLKNLLLNFCGLSSGDLNSSAWTQAIADAGDINAPCTITLIDQKETPLDVIGKLNQSHGLWFYTDTEGLYAAKMYTAYGKPSNTFTSIDQVLDELDDSFKITPTKTIYTRMGFTSQTGTLLPTRAPYRIDSVAELTLPQAATVWDLPYSLYPDDNAGDTSPYDGRLQLMSDSQDYVDQSVAIERLSSGLTLGADIALTHKWGIGRDGFVKRAATIVGMSIDLQPGQEKVGLTGMLRAPLYGYDPSTVPNSNTMPTPWTTGVDGGGHSAIHINSGKIKMEYNASSDPTVFRAVHGSTDRFISQQSMLVFDSATGPASGGPAVRLEFGYHGTGTAEDGFVLLYDLTDTYLTGPTLVILWLGTGAVSVVGSAVNYTLNKGDELKLCTLSDNQFYGFPTVWGEVNGTTVVARHSFSITAGSLAKGCGAYSQCQSGGSMFWSYSQGGILQFS